MQVASHVLIIDVYIYVIMYRPVWLSGFSDLNPRWSGWPRRQTQAVFGTMSRITNMFVAPLSSDHRGSSL